jgi:hypothetical protein
MVSAEQQLASGGLEYNPDVCLRTATVATVSRSECAVGNCCGHVGLLSRSVHLYNQHSQPNHGKDVSLSLSAYHVCVTNGVRLTLRREWQQGETAPQD